MKAQRYYHLSVPLLTVNPYPGSWKGGKIPPVHFCLCISKTVRDTAMHFLRHCQGLRGLFIAV